MRFQEIKIPLFEVNMSPSGLRKAISQIKGAKAGIEFEMYVPNLPNFGNNEEMGAELDFSEDRIPHSIDEVCEWFAGGNGGDGNTWAKLRELRTSLKQEYKEFCNGVFNEEWEINGRDWIAMFQASTADISVDDLSLAAKQLGDRAWAYHNSESKSSVGARNLYRNARHRVRDDLFEEPSEKEWFAMLEDKLSYFGRKYNLEWTYYENGSSTQRKMDSLANEFSGMIGRPVEVSNTYHGDRTETGYVIEPDASLDRPKDAGDAGLEFISPPLSVDEMIKDLHRVMTWAKAVGCYTNRSTGLHMNVSLPSYKRFETLDFVKLVLFMGDQFVLQQFGREFSGYAKSAMKEIEDLTGYGREAQQILDGMRSGINIAASKLLHSGATEKYTSVHTHPTHVEFRGPGDNWLGFSPDILEATLLRFVVALDIACDPNKYRNEYAKKMYKLLTLSGYNAPLDVTQWFASYAAGLLPLSALKIKLQNNAGWRKMSRAAKATDPPDTSDYFDATIDANQHLTPADRLQRISIKRLLTLRNENGRGSPNYEAYQNEFLHRREGARQHGGDITLWDRWAAQQAGIPVSSLDIPLTDAERRQGYF